MTIQAPLTVDAAQPLNWGNPIAQNLLRGVRGLWLPLPSKSGGTNLYDLSPTKFHATEGDGLWGSSSDWQYPVLNAPNGYSLDRESDLDKWTAIVFMSRQDTSTFHAGLSKGSYDNPKTRNYWIGYEGGGNRAQVQWSNGNDLNLVRFGSIPSGEMALIGASIEAGRQDYYVNGQWQDYGTSSTTPDTTATSGYMASTDGVFRMAGLWYGKKSTYFHRRIYAEAQRGFPNLLNRRESESPYVLGADVEGVAPEPTTDDASTSTPDVHTRTFGDIDETSPLNEDHPLLRDMEGVWLPTESRAGGSRIYDVSGNGRHGNLTNMNPDTDWGHGAGASLPTIKTDPSDGNQSILLPSFAVTGAITVWAYVKNFDWMSAQNEAQIAFLGDGPPQFELFARDNNLWWIYWDGSTDYGIYESVSTPSLNDWHLISASFDGNSLFELYIDGDLKKSVVDSVSVNFNGTANQIGNHVSGTRTFDGLFSGVGVHKRRFSAKEHSFLSDQARRGFPDLLNRRTGSDLYVLGGAGTGTTYTVSGTVTDSGGTAIQGATVSLENVSGAAQTTDTTDASGAYSISVTLEDADLPDTWDVVASDGEYENQLKQVNADTGTTSYTVDYSLTPSTTSYTMSGAVTDDSGTAIGGATVTWEKADSIQLGQATTDASGNYSITASIEDRNAPNDTTVTASTGGHVDETTTKTVDTGATGYTADFSLVAKYTVSGTVTDKQSNAIEGATVIWELSGGTQLAETTTAADGTYSMTESISASSLPDDTTLTAKSSGHADQTKQTTVDTTSASYTTDYSLTTEYTLSGTVTDNGGTALDGATVIWEYSDGTQIAQTTTDGSGNYSFTKGIVPGDLPNDTTVTAESAQHANQTKQAAVDTASTSYAASFSLALSTRSPSAVETGAFSGEGSITVDSATGTLYAVAVTTAEPTKAQIENGQNANGNPAAGTGSQGLSSTGNKTLSFSGLAGSTAYDVYFYQTDGSAGSNVLSAQFTTLTEMALTGATAASTGPTSADSSVNTNRASGTLYAVATTTGQPTKTQIINGENANGNPADGAGSQAISSTGTKNISFSGVEDATAYDVYFYQTDGPEDTAVAPASFSTPPGIALSSPTAAEKGSSNAEASVDTATGSGTLYAVATTTAQPSNTQIKNGENANGNAAGGTVSLALSSTGTKTVAFSGLTSSTSYSVYFYQEDGSSESDVESAAFTTLAVMTLANPTASSSDTTTGDGSVDVDRASGTLYAVAVTTAQPSKTQIKSGENANGNAAAGAGTKAVSSTGTKSFSFSSLAEGTSYSVYFYHEDSPDDTSVAPASFATETGVALSNATATENGSSAGTSSVDTNRGSGTLYAVATTTGEPSKTQIENGNNANGNPAGGSASQALSSTGTKSLDFSGLSASTAYNVYFYQTDGAEDSSVKSAPFTTLTAMSLTSASATSTDATSGEGSVDTNRADGTLYAVAVTTAEPTKSQIKSGQNASGNAASGSNSTAISSTGTKTLAFSGLDDATTYNVYFYQEDALDDSSVQSTAFSTGPAIALSNPAAAEKGSASAEGFVDTDQAGGTIYAVATTTGEPTKTQIANGENANGNPAGGANSQAVSSTGTNSLGFSGLAANTSYSVYFYQEDGASESDVESAPVTTLTAMALSNASGAATGSSTGEGSVDTNRGDGTLYAVAVATAQPTKSQIKNGENANGNPAGGNGTQVISSTGTKSFNFSDLSAETSYSVYFYQEDSLDDTSVASGAFTTDIAISLSSTTASENGSSRGTASADTNRGSGTLYAVATATGQPTKTQIENGQNANSNPADGSSSQSLSSTGTKSFDFSGLSPNTSYNVYVYQTNGADDSSVRAAPFTTLTAMTLANAASTAASGISADGSVDVNRGSGTLYAVAVTTAEPTKSQIKSGQNANGNGAAGSGSQPVTSTGTKSFDFSGLSTGTNYSVYFYQEDSPDDTPVASASFSTETGVTLTNPAAVENGSHAGQGSVDVSRGAGTLYAVATITSEPTKTQIENGENSNGDPAEGAASQVLSSSGTKTLGFSGLTADRTFTVYFYQTDESEDSSVQSATFSTLTEMELTAPTATAMSATTAALSVDTNRGGGVLYAVAATTAQPTEAQIKNGQNANGLPAQGSESKAVSSAGTKTLDVSGLDDATDYNVYYYQTDDPDSSGVVSSTFSTGPAIALSSPTAAENGSEAGEGTISTDRASGTLYAVATATAEPTKSQIKSGEDANGNPASGAASVAVSASGSQTVSFSGLASTTTYSIYYYQEDGESESGVKSASFTTLTPISLASAIGSETGPNSGEAAAYTNRGQGTVYAVAVTTAEPTQAQIKNGENAKGNAANGATSATVSASGTQTLAFTGLPDATGYNVYLYHEDSPDASTTSSTQLSTPPAIALSGATASTSARYTGEASVDTGTGAGTLYAVAVTTSAPTKTQIKNGENANGNAAAAESRPITSAGTKTIAFSGLTEGTSYDVYFYQESGADESNVDSAVLITESTVPLDLTGPRKIVDQKNDPLPDATVYAIQIGAAEKATTATTDQNGEAQIPEAVSGQTYRVWAEKDLDDDGFLEATQLKIQTAQK